MSVYWRVNGTQKIRDKLTPIHAAVTTSRRDSTVALRKAKSNHPHWREISVTERKDTP